MTMGFMVFVTGLLSDLISQNRQLTEIALEKIREMQLREQETSKTVPERPAAEAKK